jgi:hypothetical protein
MPNVKRTFRKFYFKLQAGNQEMSQDAKALKENLTLFVFQNTKC